MSIKKGFPFSLAVFAHLVSKFEKALIWPKYIFFFKGIQKRRILHWFQIRWKVFKNVPKKAISKNVMKICTFSTFTHVRQTCFAYNLFLFISLKLFNGFEISMKFCFFDTCFDKKKIISVIIVLFQTLNPNEKNSAKYK